MSVSGIHLHSGTTLLAPSTPIIIELPMEEEEHQNFPIHPSMPKNPELVHQFDQDPPFPQRLEVYKKKEEKEETTYDILD